MPSATMLLAPCRVSSPGLEHKFHCAGQSILLFLQQFGSAQQRGCVHVVPAGVGNPFPAGSEGQAALLLHGQRVHIRPQKHGFSRTLSARQGRDAAVRQLGGFKTHLPQALQHKSRGFRQRHACFRVAVQIPAPCRKFRLQRLRPLEVFHAAIPSFRGTPVQSAVPPFFVR